MEFIPVLREDGAAIQSMSAMATAIVREHFDPIIGTEQNDYMLEMFQTPEAIEEQIRGGLRYYFVAEQGERIGFLAFRPKDHAMYLSKFYLHRSQRGKGYARQMLDFVILEAESEGLHAIELNVNKSNGARRVYEHLGFKAIRFEKNDIGNGFYMDDCVYRKEF